MESDNSLVLIRRKDVERITTLSRSRIYKLMQEGTFPKCVPLGPMSVAWVETEVQEWIKQRITEFRNSSEG